MERFWRSYKWECVYLRGRIVPVEPTDPGEALAPGYKWECVYLRGRMGLKELKEITRDWLRYYNSDRPHQALGYKTPDEVYYNCRVAV